MGEKYLTPSAVILLLLRKNGDKTEVLCQRRKNTGFADGLFDFSCAGKVEKDETMTQTVIREAREELCLNLQAQDIKFAVLVHKRDKEFDVTFYNAYFIVENFNAEPKIGESEKCAELKWFSIDDLPADIIPDRKTVLQAYLEGAHYLEYGW